MKCLTALSACLLLLWTLTAPVSCESTTASSSSPMIVAKTVSDGIELSCGDTFQMKSKNGEKAKTIKLTYRDDNTGEYSCVATDDSDPEIERPKIYVKFRSCDNCVELDTPSIVGIAVGNVVATIVIGVAVYLLAAQTRIGPVTSHKSSDRQRLVQNEVSNRPTDDNYQVLRHKGKRDTYDVLTNRR